MRLGVASRRTAPRSTPARPTRAEPPAPPGPSGGLAQSGHQLAARRASLVRTIFGGPRRKAFAGAHRPAAIARRRPHRARSWQRRAMGRAAAGCRGRPDGRDPSRPRAAVTRWRSPTRPAVDVLSGRSAPRSAGPVPAPSVRRPRRSSRPRPGWSAGGRPSRTGSDHRIPCGRRRPIARAATSRAAASPMARARRSPIDRQGRPGRYRSGRCDVAAAPAGPRGRLPEV